MGNLLVCRPGSDHDFQTLERGTVRHSLVGKGGQPASNQTHESLSKSQTCHVGSRRAQSDFQDISLANGDRTARTAATPPFLARVCVVKHGFKCAGAVAQKATAQREQLASQVEIHPAASTSTSLFAA